MGIQNNGSDNNCADFKQSENYYEFGVTYKKHYFKIRDRIICYKIISNKMARNQKSVKHNVRQEITA